MYFSTRLRIALGVSVAVVLAAGVAVAQNGGAQVLLGESGAAGGTGLADTCDAQCGSALPGVNHATTLTLRAVNPAQGVLRSRVQAIAGGTEHGVVEVIPEVSVGSGFVAVFVHRTGTAGGHALSTEAGVPSAFFSTFAGLKAQLDMLTANTVVAIASYGDVTESGIIGGSRSELNDALVAMGAPPAIHAIGPTEAFTFVGMPGMGVGNGFFARADAATDRDWDQADGNDGRMVESTALLFNDQLFAASSAQLGTFNGVQVTSGSVTIDDGSGGLSQAIAISETDGEVVFGGATQLGAPLTVGTLGGAGGGLLGGIDGAVGAVTLHSNLSISPTGALKMVDAPTFASVAVGTGGGGLTLTSATSGTLSLGPGGILKAPSVGVTPEATLPATCTPGQIFVDDAVAGSRNAAYGCTETDTWRLLSRTKDIPIAYETFDDENTITGWSLTGADDCTGDCTTSCDAACEADYTKTSDCAGVGNILGGHNLLGGITTGGGGPDHVCVQKTFVLPTHSVLGIEAMAWRILSWDETERLFVKVDGTEVLDLNHTNNGYLGGLAAQCSGVAARPAPISLLMPHTAGTATVGFCYLLDQDPSDESFGVGDVHIFVRE